MPSPTPEPDSLGGTLDGTFGDSGGLSIGALLEGRLPVIAWLVTTMLGVMVFAWALRRPEGEETSPLAGALSMVALARGGGRQAVRVASEAPVGSGAVGTVDAPAAEPVPSAAPDPSSLTGNRANGWQSRPALRFDRGPARGVVRRPITYRLVRLSDGPDELHSREIMRLDRGDEIEIVSEEGNVIQVRTPTGEVGWIPGVSILG